MGVKRRDGAYLSILVLVAYLLAISALGVLIGALILM